MRQRLLVDASCRGERIAYLRDSLAANARKKINEIISRNGARECAPLALERTRSRGPWGNRAQSQRVQPQRKQPQSLRCELPPLFAMIASSQPSCAFVFSPAGMTLGCVCPSHLPSPHTSLCPFRLSRPFRFIYFSPFSGVFCFLRPQRSRLSLAHANSRYWQPRSWKQFWLLLPSFFLEFLFKNNLFTIIKMSSHSSR